LNQGKSNEDKNKVINIDYILLLSIVEHATTRIPFPDSNTNNTPSSSSSSPSSLSSSSSSSSSSSLSSPSSSSSLSSLSSSSLLLLHTTLTLVFEVNTITLT
jgi:hypothetical protein